MQYIVITRRRSEKFPESDYTPERLAAETAAVRKLYGDGIVRHIWHRGDVGGACLLLEVETEDGVKSALDRLPLFGLGMQEAVSIVPLTPYRGFAAE